MARFTFTSVRTVDSGSARPTSAAAITGRPQGREPRRRQRFRSRLVYGTVRRGSPAPSRWRVISETTPLSLHLLNPACRTSMVAVGAQRAVQVSLTLPKRSPMSSRSSRSASAMRDYVKSKSEIIRLHLAPFFGDTPIQEITAGKVQEYESTAKRRGLIPKPASPRSPLAPRCTTRSSRCGRF